MYRKLRMLVLSLFVLSLAAWAADDPLMGTWKANPAKSSPPAPGATPGGSYVIKREPYGKDGEKSTGDRVIQGQTLHVTYAAEYDGKDYPYTGDPTRDAVSIKRVNASTTVQTFKKAGKVVQVNTRFVSSDGRMVIILVKGTNAQGQETNSVTVWDKQ